MASRKLWTLARADIESEGGLATRVPELVGCQHSLGFALRVSSAEPEGPEYWESLLWERLDEVCPYAQVHGFRIWASRHQRRGEMVLAVVRYPWELPRDCAICGVVCWPVRGSFLCRSCARRHFRSGTSNGPPA